MLVADELFAVADGLGGHRGGEVASALAVETLAAEVKAVVEARTENRRPLFRRRPLLPLPRMEDLLAAVDRANQEIIARSLSTLELTGMGSTLCVLAVVENNSSAALAVVNVGDSRVYRCDESGFRQLTQDHTVVWEMLKAGVITPEEAEFHENRNQLSRALGVESRVVADDWVFDPVSGHRYLLCSDGLTHEVADRDIHAILLRFPVPGEAAEALVDLALRQGGSDNITVVVVDVIDATCQ
ncbi:PP2C family protein-serine/threonine phosphatase [Candidatus Poriferisocius sp.]|uniref:PP2C family protein-serine/threonine phosphatase n=1 Tax=Candidatus Poriferisocius sp. TaxID=3101276 RepID=UPI003B017D28